MNTTEIPFEITPMGEPKKRRGRSTMVEELELSYYRARRDEWLNDHDAPGQPVPALPAVAMHHHGGGRRQWRW